MSNRAREKKKPPELRVVFDTNVLWTGSASDLLKQEVVDLIEANSQHSDLTVSWYLPDAVRHERQFQMLSQSLDLLPSIKKLERLLGHNLNITEEIIVQRVNDAVERQLKALGINVICLDPSRVDWKELALNASYRRPPFSQGEKEKGFRDALLLEAFIQLVSDSPVTPKVCRIAFVTGDGLLSETVLQRTRDNANVRILSSLEELKSLINTLVAEVGEEFVQKIQSRAGALFFEADQEATIYYKENIRMAVLEKFKKQLRALPEGATQRENGTWYVARPRFLKKVGQRVSWATRISVEAKGFRYEHKEVPAAPVTFSQYPSVQATPLSSIVSLKFPTAGVLNESTLLSSALQDLPLIVNPLQKILVKTGKSVFEVIWSITVTATGKLSAPKVDTVKFVETSWEEPTPT